MSTTTFNRFIFYTPHLINEDGKITTSKRELSTALCLDQVFHITLSCEPAAQNKPALFKIRIEGRADKRLATLYYRRESSAELAFRAIRSLWVGTMKLNNLRVVSLNLDVDFPQPDEVADVERF